MEKKNYIKTLTDLKSKISTQNAIILLLSASVAGLSAKISTTEPTAIALPPVHTEEIRFTGSEASIGFAKDWAFSLTSMLGNVTPATVDATADAVTKYLAPKAYKKVAGVIGSSVENIKKNGVSRRLDIKSRLPEIETNKIFVTGEVTSFDALNKPRKEGLVTYEYIIKIKGGLPLITHFDVYEGKARTIKVLKRLESIREKREQAKLLKETGGQ